ncbi:ATP-binding cassette domain-containing protein [Deinococcus cellulosilyticus]|uniref:Molybdate ABC transporter ATP-binding protein ModF n=1 Tax=Deinococcus cellulosilyticus (strain DSM 18568 / NBRC 106333 / KACC 11606 / 5516J-15) TaxID=1223518 RepID=A0A511N2D8_DEIC1|nr:ATP-binding cassette domain-containing protein [Deinococcus cellulosilyticus]GEM47020.1 molybdate ABC transporter ATP-binding protein ModF [Deinococcus cellulosilyticus NBRC 106333 = KACC 11606]
MSSPLLLLEHVHVKLQNQRVLHDLNWTLEPGQHWAIYGSNGAGKSTFFKLVRGDLWPEHGGLRQYNLTGTPTESPIQARERIALVSPEAQDWYLLQDWEQSALQVVLTGLFQSQLLYQHIEEADRVHAHHLLEQLWLTHLENRDVRMLSQGERRRVLLARALIGKPQVLLLDEFFEGVDTPSRAFLKKVLEDVAHRTTILYSTHRTTEELPFTTHALTLKQGHLEVGRPEMKTPPMWGHGVQVQQSGKVLVSVDCPETYREEQLVLKNIRFEMHEGEHWAILGANGSGKSTLAKLIRKELYPAYGGKVLHHGQEVSAWVSKKEFALVAGDQQHRHKLNVPARIVIASGFFDFVGRHDPLSNEQEARLEQVIELLQLQEIAEKPASILSQGQMKKVLLARAVVGNPKVIILDEALDYLDADAKMLFTEALGQLATHGTQFICIAHHTLDLPEFLTHAMVLENGEIKYSGPIQNLPEQNLPGA